jgi:hypothetical protein
MTTKTKSHRTVRWIVRLAAAFIMPPLLFVAWDQATHNFAEVQPGRIYRSGQMPASALAQTLREHPVKTVLNLRGPNPSETWYLDELATAREAGATHVDIAMSSCVWMSRVQLRALIQTFDTVEYPLLIHCAWGSERTGLVSAFAELLRPGSTLNDARAQFSIRYLFVPVDDGKVMAAHLDQYETWLKKMGLEHTPASFRRWVDNGFQPRPPSREDWPYDPYPLVVVIQPGSKNRSEPVAHGGLRSRQ